MASREQYLQREENLSAILNALRRQEEATRQTLSKELSLSWACVSELTGILIARGIVVEERGNGCGGRGRTPTVLRINPAKLFLGVDVNAMGLTLAVCDSLFHPIESAKYPVDTESVQTLQRSVINAIDDMRGRHPVGLLGIGIAMQGIYRKREGLWDFPGRNGTFKIDIGTSIKQAFSLPVIVEHDPNCILFGFSEAKHESRLLMVRIDNGIGVALCREGGFADFGALELGHTVVHSDGNRLFEHVGLKNIERRLNGQPKEQAREAIAKAGEYLGIALGNLCNLIAVDRIILCGEMMRYADDLLPACRRAYAEAVLESQTAELSVSLLMDAAYGAAKLAAARYPFE